MGWWGKGGDKFNFVIFKLEYSVIASPDSLVGAWQSPAMRKKEGDCFVSRPVITGLVPRKDANCQA